MPWLLLWPRRGVGVRRRVVACCGGCFYRRWRGMPWRVVRSDRTRSFIALFYCVQIYNIGQYKILNTTQLNKISNENDGLLETFANVHKQHLLLNS